MPPLGRPPAEAIATLGRIAHDRFVDDEIGSLLERLRPLEESLEYDPTTRASSGHPPGLEEGATRPLRAAHRAPPRRLRRASQVGRGTQERRLRGLLPRARAESRAEETLRRVLRVGGLAVHKLLDDFEPFMKTTEVAEVFDADKPVLRSSCARPWTSTRRSSTSTTRRTSSASSASASPRPWGSRTALGASTRPPIRSASRSLPATCGSRPATTRPGCTAVVDAARGRARPVRARDLAHARTDAARERALPRAERVAEPHLGEPRRPQPAVLDALVPASAGHVPRPARHGRPRRLRRRDQPR